MTIHVPNSSSARRVVNSTCATATMEARASPRKPIVVKANRSSALAIFDVACLSKARRASVSDMPLPLSMTWTRVRPPSVTTTCTLVAPASIAFSTSSFTTDAGRCTTSPAAIWFATESGNKCITSFIYQISP